jgi:cytochrome c biogenesis protein CcmG/thiol:disulfide interchange protein DsbE
MEILMQIRFFRNAALVSACLLFSCGSAPTASVSETAQASAVEEPRPAPDFALPDAQGNEVKLSDLKGKVVLLNFWATWCGPCKIEMPWFVEFQRDYKDKGFAVVAVSLDEEGWEVVKPFAEDLKLNFPVVVGDDELADKFGGIAALPTTFIIDKEGKITATHTGLVSKSDYKDEIESLL